MTAKLKMIAALALVWAFALGASEAQVGSPNGGPSKTTSRRVHPKPKEQSSVASQIEELRREMASQRQAMESQQSQIETLKQQLSQRDAQLVQAQHAAVGTEASAKQQQQQFSENAQAVASLQNSVADLKTNITSVVSTVQEQQTRVNKVVERQGSPLAFKIGAAEFTPGGFLDLTSIFRTTNVGSGIGTSFGSIPFNNSLPAAALTESRFSPQNSRLSLKVDANVSEFTHVAGYVETDFLGFQPPNADQTSNSDSLRIRLYWANVKYGAWEILGGQSWSLMTPNRVGLSPTPSDIFYSQDMDTNYQVGLIWARQAQFRVTYHPTNVWAIGVSLENPQQYVPGSVVFPNSSFATQFDNGSGSTSASSSGTNTATPNLHPDIVVKTALDWKLAGRAMHVEEGGVLRSFKVFNNLTSPGSTNTITGGGGSVNANLELIRNFHLIANTFYSCGGGRYIFGLGPDVIVKPNGTLSCVHSGSGIGGFEWQTTPKFMAYGYYGGAYYQRNFDFIAAGTGSTPAGTPCPAAAPPTSFNCVGFGFPGSSTSANRAIQEGTIGFIPTIWKSPDYGALQVISQYSYLTRAPWYVANGAPKTAHVSMVYLDLRYVLP